jgi:hypothetical protein
LRDFGTLCKEGNHGNHEVSGNFDNFDILDTKGKVSIDNHANQEKHAIVTN